MFICQASLVLQTYILVTSIGLFLSVEAGGSLGCVFATIGFTQFHRSAAKLTFVMIGALIKAADAEAKTPKNIAQSDLAFVFAVTTVSKAITVALHAI